MELLFTTNDSIFAQFPSSTFPVQPDTEYAKHEPERTPNSRDQNCYEPRLLKNSEMQTSRLWTCRTSCLHKIQKENLQIINNLHLFRTRRSILEWIQPILRTDEHAMWPVIYLFVQHMEKWPMRKKIKRLSLNFLSFCMILWSWVSSM